MFSIHECPNTPQIVQVVYRQPGILFRITQSFTKLKTKFDSMFAFIKDNFTVKVAAFTCRGHQLELLSLVVKIAVVIVYQHLTNRLMRHACDHNSKFNTIVTYTEHVNLDINEL